MPGGIIAIVLAQIGTTERRMAHDHDHDDHDHDHEHGSELSEMQLRVRALETILTEKGYVDPAALDRHRRGLRDQDRPAQSARASSPRPGPIRHSSRRCSRTRPRRSRRSAMSAASAIIWSRSRTRRERHNMVVCTLCSCYPWEVLGLPPVWYKSAPYRSRAVKDPRGVLADFGVSAAEGDRDPRVGFDRRDALPRAADAARRAPRAGARSSLPSWSRATR